jgi:hypothetical protein
MVLSVFISEIRGQIFPGSALAGSMQLKRATAWEVIGFDEKEPIVGQQSASPNGGDGI